MLLNTAFARNFEDLVGLLNSHHGGACVDASPWPPPMYRARILFDTLVVTKRLEQVKNYYLMEMIKNLNWFMNADNLWVHDQNPRYGEKILLTIGQLGPPWVFLIGPNKLQDVWVDVKQLANGNYPVKCSIGAISFFFAFTAQRDSKNQVVIQSPIEK